MGQKHSKKVRKNIDDNKIIIEKNKPIYRKRKMEITEENIALYENIVLTLFSKFDFPCIYLLEIGKYKEFDNVYKFGRTDNFIRRYKEHSKTYNVIPIVHILQYIDPDYLSKAEVDIKNYMNSINSLITTEHHDELVSLNDKQLKSLITIYKDINHKYSVKTDVLQNKIDELNNKMELMSRDYELKLEKLLHKCDILEKEKIILEKENIILENNLDKNK